MKAYDIDRLTPAPNYRVNLSWDFLLDHLARWEEVYSLAIAPILFSRHDLEESCKDTINYMNSYVKKYLGRLLCQ